MQYAATSDNVAAAGNRVTAARFCGKKPMPNAACYPPLSADTALAWSRQGLNDVHF